MECAYCEYEIAGDWIKLESGRIAHDTCCITCCACERPAWKNESRPCVNCGDAMCATCYGKNQQHCA